MNTLQQLNQYSTNTVLDLADDRPAGIIVDREFPLQAENQVVEIVSTTVNPEVALEIEEIVNYTTANLRYRVTIYPGVVDPLVGSTITWPTLPTGITSSTVGNVYTLSGFKSKAEFDQVKNFTWNLPANYATKPLWYLQTELIYFDEELGQDTTKDWFVYDEDFYYYAQLTSNFSTSVVNTRVKFGAVTISSAFSPVMSVGVIPGINVAMSSTTSMSIIGQAIPITNFNATLPGIFNSVFTAVVNRSASGSFVTVSDQTTIGDKFKGLIETYEVEAFFDLSAKRFRSTPISNFSLFTVSLPISIVYDPVYNMSLTRTYRSNNINGIFLANIPYIGDPNLSQVYTVTFTCPNGVFNDTADPYNSYSTLSYTGTVTQINDYFPTIRFFPTKDFTGNTTFTYKQYKNSIEVASVTAALNYQSAGTLATSVYNINTAGSGTWQPLVQEYLYGQMDYMVIGGGGGIGSTSHTGGGGGGKAYYYTAQPILSTSYPYTVGAGGTPGNNGGNTTFNSITANGGTKGQGVSPYNGGSSASGQLGGDGAQSGVLIGGGGGGGENGNGSDATIFSARGDGGQGGNGLNTSITGSNKAYSRGGYGSSYATTVGTLPRTLTTDSGTGGHGRSISRDFPETNEPYVNAADGAVIIRVYPL